MPGHIYIYIYIYICMYVYVSDLYKGYHTAGFVCEVLIFAKFARHHEIINFNNRFLYVAVCCPF